MSKVRRMAVACVATAALAAAAVAGEATEAMAGTTDVSWALDQSTKTYGGGTQFTVSGGGAVVQYRWLETLTKDTVISGNACFDYSLLGSTVIGAGSTSYQTLFSGASNQCFVLRGRVASGQGATTTRTGRVSR